MATMVIVGVLLLVLALVLVASPAGRPAGRGRVRAIQVSRYRDQPTIVYVFREGDAGRETLAPLYEATPSSVGRIRRLGLKVGADHRDEDGRRTVYEA